MEQPDNRRSSDAGGLSSVIKRAARRLPIFALSAIASCALWYYVFHVPLERLGMVAAVPCIVGFVMMRILALVIPASAKEGARPSVFFQWLVLVSVFAAFIAADFFFSSAIYYGLGLGHVIIEALRIALFAATSAAGLIVIALVTGFPELWTTVLRGALQVLRAQTKLTDDLFISPPRKNREVA